MGEHGEVAHRRRLPDSAAPETPLEDEDLLGRILVRLPPRPSSLPRASLVCERWRRLVADPHFLRSFRAHHRRPPLLGFFSQDGVGGTIELTPALDPPDRLPAARFTLPVHDRNLVGVGCRHGRFLAIAQDRPHYLVVWDPVTGDKLRLALPSAFDRCQNVVHGAVTCAARDEDDHVHGGCPFQVVAVCTTLEGISACVYSSEAGAWGNLISMLWPSYIAQAGDKRPFLPLGYSSTQVGNRICWLLMGMAWLILEFDLGGQSLAVTDLPPVPSDIFEFFNGHRWQFLITHAGGGGIGFLFLSGFNIRLWKRKPNSGDVAGWIPGNTIELSSLLSLSSGVPKIIGFVEDDNTVLLLTDDGVFMVHLETLQVQKLSAKMYNRGYHPFTSFYPIRA